MRTDTDIYRAPSSTTKLSFTLFYGCCAPVAIVINLIYLPNTLEDSSVARRPHTRHMASTHFSISDSQSASRWYVLDWVWIVNTDPRSFGSKDPVPLRSIWRPASTLDTTWLLALIRSKYVEQWSQHGSLK